MKFHLLAQAAADDDVVLVEPHRDCVAVVDPSGNVVVDGP